MEPAKFRTDLETRDLGGRLWEVRHPLDFFSAKFASTFRVPAGTITDLASIPWGLWNIVPKVGPYDRAAVLHDAGYHNCLINTLGYSVYITKKQADELFLEAMLADGVGKFRAKLMYYAVKFFGRMKNQKVGPDVSAA